MHIKKTREYLERWALLARDEIIDNASDIGMANHFVDLVDKLHPNGRCIVHAGKFYHYEPSATETTEPDGLWRHIDDTMLAAMIGYMDGAYIGNSAKQMNMSSRKVDCIIKTLKRDGNLIVPDSFFSRPHMYGVGFRDQFVQVLPEGLHPERFEGFHKLRHKLSHDWHEQAVCPGFLELLNTVWQFDENKANKIAIFQEFIGAAMCGIATRYDKCLILEGGGNNGKSTLIDVIKLLFPKSATAAVSMKRWDQEYYVASLDGVMLNCVAEMPPKRIMDSDNVKAVIAGDEVVGRHAYGKPFTFQPSAAHIFAANELPESSDSSSGFWRRFTVLRFNRDMSEIPESHRKTRAAIIEEIRAEIPGIAKWALEGAVRLLNRGKYTSVGDQSLEEWKNESGSVPHFIDDACELTDEWTRLADIMVRYKSWASLAGASDNMGQRTLGRRLTSLGVVKKRKSDGTWYRIEVKPIGEWGVTPTGHGENTESFFN